MNAVATITCECGCMFDVSFQTSSHDIAPECPQCHKMMNENSWVPLRKAMSELSDINHHIIKWSLEYNHPRMLVTSLAGKTF